MRHCFPLTLLFICCFGNLVFGIDSRIDSLLTRAERSLELEIEKESQKVDIALAKYVNEMQETQRVRYYQFKGGYEGKKGNKSEQLIYYQMALNHNLSNNPALNSITHYGLAMAYKSDSMEKSIDHAEKSLAFASEANDGTWIIHSAHYLYRYYKLQNDSENANRVLKELTNTKTTNSMAKYTQAKFFFNEIDLKKGIMLLEQLVVDDPEYQNTSTLYALMRLAGLHLGLNNFQKAEKMIEILQSQKDRLSKEDLGYIHFYQANLEIGTGQSKKALKHLKTAIDMIKNRSFLEMLFLKSYLLYPKKRSFLDDFDFGIIKNTVTSRLLTSLVELQVNGNQEKSFLSAAKIVQTDKSIGLNQKISVIEELLQYPVADKLKVRAEDLLRMLSDLKTAHFENQRKKITALANARNDAFNELLKNTLADLEVKESVLKKERAEKKLYFKFGGFFFTLLVVVSLFLLKVFYDKNKIIKLSKTVQKNNEELENYNEEYETMLMILGHQVKQPINQLYYGFEDIKKGLRTGSTTDLELMIDEITSSTAELSNRVNIILSLIKSSLWEKEIPVKRIDLYKLLSGRLSFHEEYFAQQAISLDIKIQEGVSAYTNEQSLSVIFDNLFENVKKYGASGDKLLINITEENGQVKMVLRNSISDKSKHLSLLQEESTDQKSKDSFGLGLEIVRKLCKKLRIGFDYNAEQRVFMTRLTLSSIPHSVH